MRIAVAQIDPVVGAFDSNVKKIAEAYARACQAGARLLLTPELGVCGYPPHDLIDRPEMVEKCESALLTLAKLTQDSSCALAVGHVSRNPTRTGRASQNTASILQGGRVVFSQSKTLLPTYDVFDEARYFEPADKIALWDCDGIPIALAICEDLWSEDLAFGRKIYRQDPVNDYQKLGAKIVLSMSSSPYEWGKRARRESLHGLIAKRLGGSLIYVNQVGANDEILFDGGSFAIDSSGNPVGRLSIFKASFGVVETEPKAKWVDVDEESRDDGVIPEIETLARGLVLGVGDYFAKTGFKGALLGLSGGIDSAVVAALAVRALGAGNVHGVAMPSQYSSGHSLEDAEILARNLGITFEVKPIKFMNATAARELSEGRGALAPLALENLQARLRGLVLMTLSNHYGKLVLTTGNKSELAMGYCTLYGDMCGALAPIGDVFKTRVYELARYINAAWGAPIPDRSITKPPSAELRPGQTDQDTLPPYEDLDALLESYLENHTPVLELKARFAHLKDLSAVLRQIESSEYKRRQAAPVLKISHKAFGIGRRIPVAKTWDQ